MKGIDIYSGNGNVDFNAVKASGVDIIYIKATEGITYTDITYKDFYSRAKAAGLKVGFYHFLRANNPVNEAQHFLNTVGNLNVDCKYAIDVEVTMGQNKEKISSNVKQFADYLKSKGKDVCVYTYSSFYRGSLDDTVKDLPLWIAEYGVNKPSISPYVGFQYSETGHVNGISSHVDLDNFSEGILIKNPYTIQYQAHVQDIGWQNAVGDSEVAGTTGQGLRLEALTINSNLPGELKFQAHVQDMGWQSVRTNGEIVGTVGQDRRIEAIKIWLEGAPSNIHIGYQAHVQGQGWQNPVRDGQIAGTEGQGLRLEALKINIVVD